MQTTVNPAGQPVAVAGQLSDNQEGVDIVSRFNAEASANIAFGLAVAPVGTQIRDGVINMAGSGDVVEGVNVWGFNHMPGSNGDLDQTSTPPGLRPKAGLQVIQRGRVWVVVDAGVTSIVPNIDRAFVRYSANGGNTVVGAFSNATDSGHNTDITKQAIFRSGIFLSADGVTKIAELDVDFVNKA